MAYDFELENISFAYSPGQKNCVEELSFNLEAGKFTAILGPNGAGKSTVIKLLLGILKPKQGRIKLRGRELEGYGEKERARLLAYLPQNSRANHLIKVSEVVLMGRYPWRSRWSGMSREDRLAFERAVELSGLSQLLDRSYSELSGGERQRVLLARAICQNTACLLLDEAANNLDLAYQIEIFELLKELQTNESVSILAVLHDLNLAARYADQSILLKEGRLYQGPDAKDPFAAESLSQLFNLQLSWLYDEHGERHLVWQ
ncbi:MAG: ABC transporter ATP-binding protein [Eubacteriales bacterium]|nr:ABC transporter ATP-binding protein [Eubacteriales bacterium]